MPSQEHIESEQKILEAYRQTFASYRHRLALTGIAHAPPEVTSGLAEARLGVQNTKANLRLMGVKVEDLPGDEASPVSTPALQVLPSDLPDYDRKPPLKLFVENPITLGDINDRTFEYIHLPEYEDYSVECDIRILEDSDKEDNNWAGFRVRGFRLEIDHVGFGYLTLLRSQGTVELYRKEEIIGGEGDRIVDNAKQKWIRIRTDVFGSNIAVWVDGKLHMTRKDKSFGGPGFLCLHTFFVVAEFRDLQVFQIELKNPLS